jgi:alanine-synthesizing transaminase
MNENFARIERLPTYVFAITNELKARARAKVGVPPGIGFGNYGDEYVRICLIENEHRIRQAIRGIRAMFKEDGVI